MFNRRLADCFPFEELPSLWYCPLPECFYHEVLMKMGEVVWKDQWDPAIENLRPFPRCPSCNHLMSEYGEHDQCT